MCGIVGVVGRLDGVDTAAALAALAHRGPDDDGELRLDVPGPGALWFGHRRLAIQDLSRAGRQPMRSRDGRLAIVFNGEIYNFKDLRAELAARGQVFATGTDTEVILAAYAVHGAAAVDLLRGMFAFALWDASARTLVLARDRMGEKPLYYHHAQGRQDGGRFAFASEVRALLAAGVAEREFDPDGLDAYLTFGGVADPYTLVRGVRAVAPGEVLTLRAPATGSAGGDVTRRTYWSIRDIPPHPTRDRAEAVALTHERLRDSVRRCMVADVPVAVLLSGGIDSSSNVVLLAEQRWENLRTFSVVFGAADAAFSEAPYSALVAETFHTRHQQTEVSLDAAHGLVATAVEAMDQPTADGVNTFLVCDAIRRAGVKVAVSGQGADELFLGYPQRRLFGSIRRASAAVPAWLKRLAARAPRLPLPHDSPYEKALQALCSPDALAGAYLAQHSYFSHAGIERLRGARRPSPARFVLDAGGADPLDRLSRLQLTHYLRNTLLRDGDQMSMAHAVELRAPFVDSDLVELVVGLDARFKVDPARNKPLLLDAVGPALPRAVWDRPKQGFGLPFDRWLREGLTVADFHGPEIGLDAREVGAVRQRFLRGGYVLRYWALEVLAAWAKRERMGTRYL